MLTPEDLKNIGVELGKVIEYNVTPVLEQMATKEDLKEMEVLLNVKIAEIQIELEAIGSKLEILEKRVKEDTDAVVKDVLELRRRLSALEEQVKQLRISTGKV